jgi:hypothetical protein
VPRKKRVAAKAPPFVPAEAAAEEPGQAGQWLSDLARQLDGVIQEDPQKRSAGTLIIRSLIRQALKGDVRAIKECLRLAERDKTPPPETAPASPTRPGRPAKDLDLVKIQELARLGMRDITKIGRCLGVPKQTLFGPKHVEEVKEAFETGRAIFELDALREYQDDIARSRRNPLVIFKMKQLGWTDKVHSIQSDATQQDIAGARERLRTLVEMKRKLVHDEESIPNEGESTNGEP